MKPVYQTRINNVDGNCMQACIASLLEIDIKEVAEFGQESDWYDKCQVFLEAYDLQLLAFDYNPTGDYSLFLCHYILSVPSPNFPGSKHAVIAKDNKIIHDPNPNGKPIDIKTATSVEILVKRCEVKDGISK